MSENKGKPWTNHEIESIVSTYKEMLWLQVLQHKFSKIDFNRALQRKIDRSKSSIEFKHRNISAIMSVLQLPEVKGYFPAHNFQKALLECVVDWERNGVFQPIIDRLMVRPQRPMDSPIIFETPPSTDRHRDEKTINATERLIKGIHFPSYNDWRYRLNKAGEEYIYHSEIDRLSLAGRKDLSCKVHWLSDFESEDSGFDIRSFDNFGNDRFIEVKTTIGSKYNPFYLTAKEYSVSDVNQHSYSLIRLFEFGTNPKAFQLHPPLNDHVQLTPTVYEAKF